jgi:uncharacterized protein YkwD
MRGVAIGLALCGLLSVAGGCAPPPAKYFHTREAPNPIRGDHRAQSLLKQVEAQVQTARSPELQGDGRLADMALEIADSAEAERDALDGTSLALMSRSRGLVNPLPQVVFAKADTLEQAGKRLLEKGVPWVHEYDSTHYGLAAMRHGDAWAAVLVLETRPVELAPLPVALDAPGSITVDARLREDLVDPALVITQPDGTVEKPEPEHQTRHLHVTLPLSKGLWGVEVVGTGVHGATVVANLAIAVGVPMPQEYPPEPNPTRDPGVLARKLAQLIQHDRERHGLLPLHVSVELGRVARAHSRDMREARFFGHVSPTAGGPQDRVARAGVSAWNVRENIARGYTAREIHTLLMLSPAHRAAILGKHVDELGIGVASEPEGDRPAFYVTELFAHAPVEVDRARAEAQLFARVDELRRVRGLSPLWRSQALDRAAERAAQEYFTRPEASGETLLTAGINSVVGPPETKLIMATMFLDVEAEALPLSSEMLDRGARFIGIAIAQGDDPRLGPRGVVWAVVVAE